MEENKAIDIEVKLEFKDFFRNIFWQTFKKLWLIAPLALLLTPIGIYLLVVSIIASKFSPALIMPFIPGAAFLLILWSVYTSAKRSISLVKGTIQWRFSDDGYETFTPLGTSDCSWQGLEEVQEKREDFLLFPQKPLFIIIPKRSFKDEQQIRDFRELLRRNLGEKAKLKND